MVPPARKAPTAPVRNGFSGLGLSNSLLGDLIEEAVVKFLPGSKHLVGSLAGRQRQGAFDIEDRDGIWIEIKAMTVFAAEYKIKSKAVEISEKIAWANKHDRDIATIIAIVEEPKPGKRKARVTLWRRDHIGCFRLPADGRGFEYLGALKVKI